MLIYMAIAPELLQNQLKFTPMLPRTDLSYQLHLTGTTGEGEVEGKRLEIREENKSVGHTATTCFPFPASIINVFSDMSGR